MCLWTNENAMLTMCIYAFPKRSCRYAPITVAIFVSLHGCKNLRTSELFFIKFIVNKKCFKQNLFRKVKHIVCYTPFDFVLYLTILGIIMQESLCYAYIS
jgi:hypothetical protein